MSRSAFSRLRHGRAFGAIAIALLVFGCGSATDTPQTDDPSPDTQAKSELELIYFTIPG